MGWEAAKELREVRRTLQHMGTGVRALDPDFWLRVVMDAVRNHPGPAVITDVRFPNEAYAVRSAGGRTIRIIRPSLGARVDEHISETALDDFEPGQYIFNDGSLADLRREADHVAQ